jgi:hypothetical protein
MNGRVAGAEIDLFRALGGGWSNERAAPGKLAANFTD